MKQFALVKGIIDETINKKKGHSTMTDISCLDIGRGLKVLIVKSLVLKYCLNGSIITKHGKIFMPEI